MKVNECMKTSKKGVAEVEKCVTEVENHRRQTKLEFTRMEEQILSVKRRQEQIFVKQFQIQSTLHGETSLLQSPTSVLCSPPFTHVSESMSGYKVCTQQHTSDLSSLLRDSDLDSIVTLDWQDPNLLTHQYNTTAGTSASTTAMFFETFPSTQQSLSTQPCGSTAVLQQQAGSTAVMQQQAGSATVMPQPGNAEVTAFMPQQKTLHAGDARAPQEQDPNKLLEKIPTISMKDVGKVARMLALDLFGENTLKNSTVRGDVKRGLQCLDPTKLGRLLPSIFCALTNGRLRKYSSEE